MSTVAPLVEDAPTSPEGQELEEVSQRYSLNPDLDVVVILTSTGEPRGFVNRALVERGLQRPRNGLRVKPTSRPEEVARRATTRTAEERFDPILCIDEAGRYLGVVRFERLVEALAGQANMPGSSDGLY